MAEDEWVARFRKGPLGPQWTAGGSAHESLRSGQAETAQHSTQSDLTIGN